MNGKNSRVSLEYSSVQNQQQKGRGEKGAKERDANTQVHGDRKDEGESSRVTNTGWSPVQSQEEERKDPGRETQTYRSTVVDL